MLAKKDDKGNDSEPRFEPRPNQVDFTHLRYCPTLNCVVRHKGQILLLKRPQGMRLYPGLWGGVTGFLDDVQTLEEKVLEELQEETGLDTGKASITKIGAVREIDAPEYGKVWITHPVLIDIQSADLTLNWENDEAHWIDPAELEKCECTPGFREMTRDLLASPRTL